METIPLPVKVGIIKKLITVFTINSFHRNVALYVNASYYYPAMEMACNICRFWGYKLAVEPEMSHYL